MRRLAVAAVACTALAACAGVTIPQPPKPTPTPVVTPSPVCAPGQVHSCWAQPPGKGWVWVAPVYDAAGNVIGTVEVAKPEDAPQKPAAAACMVESDLQATQAGGAPKTQTAVREAIAAIGPRDGFPPAETRKLLTDRLIAKGLCAIAGQEAVFVREPSKLVAEYHAVFEGSGGWTESGNGKFIGFHVDRKNPPNASQVSGTCGEPHPPTLAADGSFPWKILVKAHPGCGGCNDSTYISIQTLAYAEAIGMSPDANGIPRAGVPVRPDGHPERVACERELDGGGTFLESRNGAVCDWYDGDGDGQPDNPMWWWGNAGNCRLCMKNRKVCSEWN